MNTKIKLLLNTLLALLPILPSHVTHAIGWWEETVIFQNKTSGEYKKTYMRLYRFDTEAFRDSLVKYIKDKPIPNDSSLKDWSVVYYKFCDREDCTTRGKINPSMNYYKLKDMTSSDLTAQELEKISHKNKSTLMGLIAIVLIITIVYRRVKSRRKTNQTKSVDTL